MLVGLNPFDQHYGSLLNWPPMWMEILYGLARISDRLDWPFFSCIRVLLIGCDAVLILSTWALLRLLKANGPARGAVLWGLALNPFLILLTIQQGNFDVIPAIGIVWFLYFLIRWIRNGDAMDWLCSAAILGLAAFAKTFPLVLLPLLGARWRRLAWKTRLLGVALCFGPTVMSLAPLYVLYPREITNHVIVYRGTPGPFGTSGVLQWLGGLGEVAQYSPYFTAGLLLAMALLAMVLQRCPPRRERDWVLLAAVVLIGVFEFGTGYCAQYWMWVAPLLTIIYVQYRGAMRSIIIVTTALVIITNILEFAYNANAGCFIVHWFSTPPNPRLSEWFNDTGRSLVAITLPMSAATFILWIYACVRMWESMTRSSISAVEPNTSDFGR